MKRFALILTLLAGVAATPLTAQKARPATTGPDADNDGVADTADRCPNTQANTRVGRDGCPLTLAPPSAAPAAPAPAGPAAANPAAPSRDSSAATGKGRRPTPSLVGGPPTANPTAAAPAAGAAPHAAGPATPANPVAGGAGAATPPNAVTGAPAGGVTQPPVTTPSAPAGAAPVVPQAAAPAAAAQPPANAFTAGLAIPAFGPGTPAPEYGRTAALMLDSAIVTLVNIFRGTSGQPLAGASGPEAISSRERDRWTRCRAVYWDLTTYRTGLASLAGSLTDARAAQAAAELDTALAVALADTAGMVECDNVSSMIAAPGRWTPWDAQYQQAARHFYGAWYADIRNVHDKTRAFAVALNTVLPANRRLAVPPALQRNAPYAGAGPR
jgi:hypothetical protein